MSKLRILDLFSCAGGAARGYQNAGFHVTGVDINPQPNYAGDAFVQGDALEYLAAHGHEYDAVHGSPPCQASCTLIKGNQRATAGNHINLIPATRAAFAELTVPTIIENVQGSDLRRDLTLCGEMFRLGVIRHRYFEVTGFEVVQPQHQKHRGRVRGWRHGTYYDGPYVAPYGKGGGKGTLDEWREAMEVPWMETHQEITECIPPKFTELIGRQLMAQLVGVSS
ncbi:DNA methylase [Rhodococcus sp. GOMB7]|uniref:DNA methylase n=1 Tax=Rhodococcus sp. GOMB7 TaxID=2839033 RepID=UPI001C007881|nr:DNA methylase [Rhodococcus sp. GOMB7]MBT9295361.1 DNA methylase [Rhodococcus sp. GOMB7]